MIIDKRWDSVGAMTRDTELVVTGWPVAVAEDFDNSYGMAVHVVDFAIDEVIKGAPVASADGHIRVVMYRKASTDLPIPSQEHLLFLRNVGSDEAAEGDTPTAKQHTWYWFAGLFQNVFADVDGRVVVPLADGIAVEVGRNAFPTEWDGRDFAELVDTTRRAATADISSRSLQVAPAVVTPLLAC